MGRMTILRATTTLTRYSAEPEDSVVNTMHYFIEDTASEEAFADNQSGNIRAFYQGIQPWLSPALSPNAGAHKTDWAIVDPGTLGEDDDTLSAIIWSESFQLDSVGSLTTALPAEVACCLSMVALGAENVPEKTAGIRPRSRYRGRIYVGPLGVNTCHQASNGESIIKSDFVDDLLAEAEDHLVDGATAHAGELVVYSRANASVRTVEKLFVDNAFDIVRSRGQKSTLRTTHVVTP